MLQGTTGRGQRLDATEGPQIEGWVLPCKDIGGRFPAAALRFDPSALERFGPEAGDHPRVQTMQQRHWPPRLRGACRCGRVRRWNSELEINRKCGRRGDHSRGEHGDDGGNFKTPITLQRRLYLT